MNNDLKYVSDASRRIYDHYNFGLDIIVSNMSPPQGPDSNDLIVQS